jgi:hypothetical protein
MPEPLIDAVRVNEIFEECLHGPEPVHIDGIVHAVNLSRERVQSHAQEINGWLDALPEPFQRTGGGGWSFLNACDDRNGEQWTGLHLVMEQLFLLGMVLKRVSYVMPRELWGALPGGMPYLVVEPAPLA